MDFEHRKLCLRGLSCGKTTSRFGHLLLEEENIANLPYNKSVKTTSFELDLQ